jgi:hypothetical protein
MVNKSGENAGQEASRTKTAGRQKHKVQPSIIPAKTNEAMKACDFLN